MELCKKIYNFITLDTGGKNESLRLILVVRLLGIIYVVHSAMVCMLDAVSFNAEGHLFLATFLVLYLLCFGLSYKLKFRSSLVFFNAITLVYIWGNIYYFGWGAGAQQMLVILLVLCYFTTYQKYLFKVCYSVLLLAYRMILHSIFSGNTAIVTIRKSETFIQIFSSVTIYVSLCVIAFIYSKESQASEGKLQEYNVQLETQANTDPLTGLYNRRRAMDYLDKEMQEFGSTGMCVCICDIDFFKKINDNYGHDIGDEVLRTLARTMQTTLGDDVGIISRWGGEEFLIVFSNCNGDTAKAKLQELKDEVAKLKFEILDRSFGITLTYGLAEYDYRSNATEFVKEADRKLYQGKENGRDQIVF